MSRPPQLLHPFRQQLRQQLRHLWQQLRHGGSLMVGVPSYEQYCQHMQSAHPDHTPLTQNEFMRARMQARYGGKNTGKCPC